MYKNQGFTLIELLVVVLIIGILAAVALPQYQKAVEKSRAAQALGVLKSLGSAMETYSMANGEAPTTFDELDVALDWSGTDKWYDLATDTRSNGDWSLQMLGDGGYRGIYMGRLTGKYKGGGFGYFSNATNPFGTNNIVCVERTSSGIVFPGNAGDYCERVFNAKPKGAAGGVRGYALP